MANFCPNCGQPVNADDVFCESCGTKLGTLNLETPEAVQRAQPGSALGNSDAHMGIPSPGYSARINDTEILRAIHYLCSPFNYSHQNNRLSKFRFGEIIVRNIINLFVKIKSFETVTLHTSGMRHVTDYEIVNRGDEAEISQYAVGYRSGDQLRQLQKRAVCSANRALKLMNKCRLLSWDGFHGQRPKGIKDGKNFILKATVNEGKEIYATGSQRFPPCYRDFTDGLYEMLRGAENERI